MNRLANAVAYTRNELDVIHDAIGALLDEHRSPDGMIDEDEVLVDVTELLTWRERCRVASDYLGECST